MVEALLVRPRLNRWAKFRAHMTQDYGVFDPDHKIYVPESFVFGNFKKRDDGFKMSEGGIFYRDSSEALENWALSLYLGRVEVVGWRDVLDGDLEELMCMSREYLNKRDNIHGLASDLLG